MVLCAGDKAEGAAGRLEDDIALGARRVINKLVEQDLGGRPDSQIGLVDKDQVGLAEISSANRLIGEDLAASRQ